MEAKVRYLSKEYIGVLRVICSQLKDVDRFLKGVVSNSKSNKNVKELYFDLGIEREKCHWCSGLLTNQLEKHILESFQKDNDDLIEMPKDYYSDIDIRECEYSAIGHLCWSYMTAINDIVRGRNYDSTLAIDITKDNYVQVIQGIIDTVKPKYDEYVLKVIDSGFLDKIKNVK